MRHWINKHFKIIVITAFLIPIITVAVVSISHVTQWYGISNPLTWAIYLSVGIEIAALSALAALTANMGKKVYFPFIIVTFIQFIGNVFFSYEYINVLSQTFTSWVELVSPIVELVGIESTDLIGHKRILALFTGGLLPVISLSFLHMLVKFTEEEREKDIKEEENKQIINGKNEILTDDMKPDIMSEMARVRLTDEELNKIEEILNKKTNIEKNDEVDEELESIIGEDETEKKNQLTNNDLETTPIDEKNIVFSALSDEEVREMFMDEWDKINSYYDDDDDDILENSDEEIIVNEPLEDIITNKSVEEVITEKPKEIIDNSKKKI